MKGRMYPKQKPIAICIMADDTSTCVFEECPMLHKCYPDYYEQLQKEKEVKVKCVCPDCGLIFENYLPAEFVESKDVWKRAGYFIIHCSVCKEKHKKVNKPEPTVSLRKGEG